MMNNDLISRSALIDEIERDIDFERENNVPITAINAFKIAIKRAKKLPTVDAVSPGAYEQIKWERDVAIKQLEELGIGFGQKKPDMEPVRHGRWIRPAFDPAWVKCSECGCYWEGGIVENCNMYFCPNCGAKMDAEVSE